MKRANSINEELVKHISKKSTVIRKGQEQEQEQFMEEQDKHKDMSGDDFDLNPYQDDKFVIKQDMTYLIDGYFQLSELESNAESVTPEEDCLLAEIEYFREKAEYYRMQRNLVALEASKMKRLLSQMGLIV